MEKYSIKLAVKFSENEQRVLDGQAAILNWTYNHLLEKACSLREEYFRGQCPKARDTLYTKRGLRNLLPELKNKHPFLKSVHSSPLKNAALRLSQSIQDHQKSKKGRRRGNVCGFPKFRSQKHCKWFSLFYDEPNKGFKVNGKMLSMSLGVDKNAKRLKVVGQLDKSLSQFCPGRLLSFRLVKEGKNFFAVFSFEREFPSKRPIKKIIALDPNHKNLAYGVGSDGRATEIKNPWFLKKMDRYIDSLKSRRDRCQKKSQLKLTPSGKSYWQPSKRWQLFHDKIQDLNRKRRDQTKTYLFTIANKLFQDYDYVSIGNYTPRGGGLNRRMRRAMNNESLIGRFKLVLSWVALKSGKHYDEWNERNSTKTCSACGFQHDSSLDPSIRKWQCPDCNKNHIRDENAAINGFKQTVAKPKMSGSDRFRCLEIKSRRAWRFNGLGIKEIPGTLDGISRVKTAGCSL